MEETRLTLTVDGMELPAVFTAPPSSTSALLLIPGSLNSDVDGNFAPMFPGQPAMRTNVYRDLAAQLTARGVAVLRFSKSGPGTGAVNHDATLVKERYARFPQRVRVAEAFLDELARRAPGLPIAIAGHSEGAVVTTLVAQRRAEVRALVLLSGPSKPLLQLMIWQNYLRDPSSPAAFEEAMAWANDYAAGRPVPDDTAKNPYAGMVGFFLKPEAEPYLRSLEQVHPAEELSRVSQPVLIVQGGRDASVMEQNAGLLQAAQPRAAIARFPELQHFYKPAPDGLAPQDSMALEGESDPAVAAAIAAWLVLP